MPGPERPGWRDGVAATGGPTRYPAAMNGGTTKQVASVPAEASHATSILAGLADDLGETLPSGSSLVVCWRDPQYGDGMSADAHASPALLAHAQACLDGATGVTDARPDRHQLG